MYFYRSEAQLVNFHSANVTVLAAPVVCCKWMDTCLYIQEMCSTQINIAIFSCQSAPTSLDVLVLQALLSFLTSYLTQTKCEIPFSNEILWRAGGRKFEGKAEGWWRLAWFFLIVGSPASLTSFALPYSTSTSWGWKWPFVPLATKQADKITN